MSEGIIAVVYCSIFQTESNGINPRSVTQTVSEILAFKVDTPLQKHLKKFHFLVLLAPTQLE